MKPSLLKRFVYFGNKRYCPICEKYSRKFDKYGINAREDALCIHCNSLERHRLVWLYLQEKTTLLDGSPRKVLHIAPEPCLETKFRRILGTEYITADLNNPKAQIKMDVTKIPFDNETFDVIYCSHVLEHVPDDRKAIREFYRVLKKDSWALILVPINVDRTIEDLSVTNPKERERLFGQHDHVRKYGPDFIKRVKESGFHAEIVLPQDFLNTDRIRVCGIGKGTPLFKCNKN